MRALLRGVVRGLATLGLEGCRCLELLFGARFGFQGGLGLRRLRGATGSSRYRGLPETAAAGHQTCHEHKNQPTHHVTPSTNPVSMLTRNRANRKGAALNFFKTCVPAAGALVPVAGFCSVFNRPTITSVHVDWATSGLHSGKPP